MESRVSGPTDVPMLEQTIGQAFDKAVADWGDRLALVVSHQDVHWSWSELGERVERLCSSPLATRL